MGAIYYKGQKYGAMPASAANLPYDAGSQDSTKDKIDANATAITVLQTDKQDALTYETDDYAVTTYGGVIRCKKWGRIVNIQGYSIGTVQNVPIGAATTLATIASKYRPNPQQHIMGFGNSGSYKYDGGQGFRINTDGTVVVYVYSGTTLNNGFFNVTFMV